jgi:hypothetical protein
MLAIAFFLALMVFDVFTEPCVKVVQDCDFYVLMYEPVHCVAAYEALSACDKNRAKPDHFFFTPIAITQFWGRRI